MNERNVSKALDAAIERLDRMDARTGGLPGTIYAMKKTLEHIVLMSGARGMPEERMEKVGRKSASLLVSAVFVSSLAGDKSDVARSIVDTLFDNAAKEEYES